MNLGQSILVCGALLLVPSCMMSGPSHMAQGQLYASGNPAYDAFFHDVHQQQVDAASWADDRKGAHHALVGSLELTPDAPDVTIVQATHEAASKVAKQAGSLKLDVDGTSAHVSGASGDGGSLFHSVEETAHAELERARRLHAVGPKLDALGKQAGDLQGRVKGDFSQNGIARQNEVSDELTSSVDVLSHLKSRAESEARESEDFVADLDRALQTASEASAAKQVAKRKKKDKPDSSASRAAAPATESPAPPKPAATAPPAAAPAPKPADPGEVFTP